MSHLLAAQCVNCGEVDDTPCPECPGKMASSHGTAYQKPFKRVMKDGYVHEFHPDCLLAPQD